jgi:hypothetical protein
MKCRNLVFVLMISFLLHSAALVQITAAGEHDALIQAAKKDYEALNASLVKKYEDGYKKAPEQDREYYRQHGVDTIRHQVKNWEWTVTDGYNAMFSFIESEDFDKAAIIDVNYHFNQALRIPMGYKEKWHDEIGPAWNAVQSCCATDDINECHCLILKKAFPYFRDFSNKIAEQVGGFFKFLDQGKLKYYDDYYKETRSFTFTWPKNATRLLNFFKGEHYEQEFRSWRTSGCHIQSPSLLTVDLRSDEGRLLVMYVNMYINEPNSSLIWLEGFLEDKEVIESGGDYLLLERKDSSYNLVHFFKGRKSLGVVYTIETDRTVDAMVRYMIFALRDYVLSGGGAPSPGPDETPSAYQVLEVEPITSTNLNTSPNKGNTCTLEVTVAGKEGAPVSGAEVVFEEPELGTLSSLKVRTDASGRAQVIYTAPTDAEVAAIGKQQADVYINAVDSATGAKGRELLHVRSTKSDMTVAAQHTILPAHQDYYNKIEFRFRAADKPDGSPYKARITARGQYAALVKELHQQGGTNTAEMEAWNNSDCTLYYHWVGPPTMKQAWEETVTIEIPELNLKQEVTFSVGIDLRIVAVQRAHGGSLFPIMWEPLHVSVVDGFHPDEDLVKLLKEFAIKTDLRIEQVHFAAAPVNPGETGFLSALITRIEGMSGSSLQEAVIWDAGRWEAHQTRDKRYVLIQRGTYADGKPWIEYPAIVFWERGTYQFKAAINPGAFDADPRNNSALTEVFEVEEFRGFSDEIIHTVFMPSAEFLANALSGFSKSLLLKMAFCTKGLAGDLHAGKYFDALVDLFGCYIDVLGDSNVAKKIKDLVGRNTLALYVKTLCETMVGDRVEKTTSVPKQGVKSVTRSAPTRAPEDSSGAKYDLDKVLEVARLAVQGTGDSYLVILEREGLVSHSASIAGGEKLMPAPQKLGTAQSDRERIEEGTRFVVIPAQKQEKMVLELKGNGRPGSVITVKAGSIKRYPYSTSPWQSTVTVDSTGEASYAGDQGQGPKPIEQTAGTSVSFVGVWKTDFGNVTATQEGNKISVTYTHDNGKIEGTMEGNVVKGRWSEAPSYKPPRDAGEFEFVIAGDGNAFQGRWCYGFEGKQWRTDWNGTRVK